MLLASEDIKQKQNERTNGFCVYWKLSAAGPREASAVLIKLDPASK